jgi:hypothetical protein
VGKGLYFRLFHVNCEKVQAFDPHGMIRFKQPKRYFENYLDSQSNFLDKYYLVRLLK